MFRDISANMDNPYLQQLLSFCLFDKTPQGIERAICKYPGEVFYGWIENNEPVGICGFRVLQDKVEICHIAVSPISRHKGIGKKMITALRKKFSKTIEAETDDDAVGFYRKCGFGTTAFQKHNYMRWACTLPISEVMHGRLSMIRDACLLDFDAIFNLENQVFQIHLNARPDMIKPDVPFSKDYYEKCLNDKDMKIFVYEENGNVLGYCITRILKHKNHHLFYDMTILEINDMCVDERVRGKAIGYQLFNHSKDYAKEIGTTKMELSVWAFNKNARQFYERLGFEMRTIRMEMTIE